LARQAPAPGKVVQLRVRFWGTRGSIATPGPGTNHFGGNTSCVELTTSAGETLILDCGTGARVLGTDLIRRATGPVRASILLGHTHWDHIQGFPFFTPVFVPGNEFDVYAPEGGQRSLHETLAGQMEYTYFPVDLGQLPTKIAYRELTEGTYQIGSVRVATQFLHHPAMTLGYRLEVDGVTVAYMADHEPFSGILWQAGSPAGQLDSILHEGDRRHAGFIAGADLVIHDAQYTSAEYETKKNWGHSPVNYAVELAAAAGVRRLVLTHHDPTHDDAFVAEMERQARELARARSPELEVSCAFEGYEITLAPASRSRLARTVAPAMPVGRGGAHPRVLIVGRADGSRQSVLRALGADELLIEETDNGRAAMESFADTKPDLVLADLANPKDDLVELVRMLYPGAGPDIPLLVLAGKDVSPLAEAGLDLARIDYLTRPFSIPQLRARVRVRLARRSHAG
jgi:phosphoribosyl 1,2-cyclic phosphodiesterase